MKYCVYCSKPIEEGEECTCEGAKEAAAKEKKTGGLSSKKIKKLIIPIAVLLVALIVVIVIVSNIRDTINLQEYIVIEGVSGLNGKGELEYHLDEDALMQVMFGDGNLDIDEENFEAVMTENILKYEEIGNALSCMTITATAEEGLSNGDTVTVTATFSNPEGYELDYRFEDGSVTYTVSGLKDGMSIDPLSDDVVTVSFTGTSGTGEAVYAVTADDEIISLFSYSLNPNYNLANGDVVTLSVSFSESKLEEKGYLTPEITERTYTVSGLTEYLTTAEDIPLETVDTFCEKAYNSSKEKETSDSYFIAKEPTVVEGAFFISAEDPSAPYTDYYYGLTMHNAIAVVTHYTMTMESDKSWERDEWIVWIYPNGVINDSGEWVYEEEEMEWYTPSVYTLEEVEEWMESEFVGMEISPLEFTELPETEDETTTESNSTSGNADSSAQSSYESSATTPSEETETTTSSETAFGDVTDPNSDNYDPYHREGYIYIDGFGYIEAGDGSSNGLVVEGEHDFWEDMNDPDNEKVGY